MKDKFETLSYSRPLDIQRWSQHASVDTVVRRLFPNVVDVIGYARVPAGIEKHIKVVVLDLYAAYLVDPKLYVFYSRRSGGYPQGSRYNALSIGYHQLIKVIDALSSNKLGYVEHYLGFNDRKSKSGFQSRMKATGKLIDLIISSGVKRHMITRPPNEEVIILKDSDKKPMAEYEDKPAIISMRNNLRRINEFLEKTLIDIYLPDDEFQAMREELKRDPEHSPIDFTRKTLRRIFNNGSFRQGGRFYHGWWQEIPSKYRPYIKINDKLVEEFDYSGMQIRMLYAREGAMPPDDPYLIPSHPSLDRDVLKLALLILINAKPRQKALASICKILPQGKPPAGFTSVDALVNAFSQVHQPIEKYFYSGIGIRLMKQESDIAEKVMLAMAKTGFPALPVHDSFIIRMGMGVDLESAMKRAFKEVTGAPAKIKPDHSSVGLVHAKRGKAWERRVELAKKKGFNPGLVSGKEEDFAYMDEYDAEYSRYLERYRESLKTGWSKMFPVKKVKKKAR